MKRFLLSLVLGLPAIALFAQNLDKAKEMFKANKIADAKTEIDKVLADPKNQKNADAWFYKAKIYNSIAANDQMKSQVPDAYAQSFDAIKKYVDYDDKMQFALMQEQYKPLTDIYQGFFQAGAASYNAGKYSDALTNFQGAINTLSYMYKKNWVRTAMDSTATLYAGISAEKANNRDQAAVYYKTIVDSGITKIGGNDMLEIYKWVADYYNQKKDMANTMKYLDIGEKYYPTDLFWADTELTLVRQTGNKDSLWAKYDEVTRKFPNNHLFFYNYGLEMYQYATDTSTGKRPANSEELIKKSQQSLTKSLAIKPDYPQAALIQGQISFNAGVELQQQAKSVKGTKPEDVKKRTDLRQQAMKKFDEALPYFEKVDQDLGGKGKLKMEEKTVLKDAYDLTITIYEQKNVKDKQDFYTNKFNNVDKDH
ncbi:MAG: hypothetical protein ACHQEM_01680 [Chitinophagales bacterium]